MRLLPLFNLIFLLLPGLALALPESRSAAPALCHALFSSLESIPPVEEKESRLRHSFRTFNGITKDDNQGYIALAEGANRRDPTAVKLVVVLENAVLKEANDRIVKDRDFVTVLENYFKSLAYAKIASDPLVGPKLLGEYSDFKSLHFALAENSPEVTARLAKLNEEINHQFAAYLGSVAQERGWQGRGLARDLRNWHIMGIGETTDEAGLAARDSRLRLTGDGLASARTFGEAEESLTRTARRIAVHQNWIGIRLGNVPGMVDPREDGVLSAELVNLVLKVNPAQPTMDSYLAALGRDIYQRFGVALTHHELLSLRGYVDDVSRLSLPLLTPERVEIDFAQKASAALSADFQGQNARNIVESMLALRQSQEKPFKEKVIALREAEQRATRDLDRRKANYKRIVSRIAPDAVLQTTGDDSVAFLSRPLTEREKRMVLEGWISEGGDASDLRLAHVNFVPGGRAVPVNDRSRLIVAAETAEKDVRKELIGKISRAQLNALSFLVEQVGLRTKFYIRGQISAPGRAKIEEWMKAKGYDYQFVQTGRSTRVSPKSRGLEPFSARLAGLNLPRAFVVDTFASALTCI